MLQKFFASIVMFGVALVAAPAAATTAVVLATTTSTQDTGLLDVLVPAFEKASGYQVKTIAVGTGAALAMGERGDADVLLVHAPAADRSRAIASARRAARDLHRRARAAACRGRPRRRIHVLA